VSWKCLYYAAIEALLSKQSLEPYFGWGARHIRSVCEDTYGSMRHVYSSMLLRLYSGYRA
jgi:hypothetical protein